MTDGGTVRKTTATNGVHPFRFVVAWLKNVL